MDKDSRTDVSGGTKTINFNLPFNEIPYIVISPASAYTYGQINLEMNNPPTAWYHHESSAGFIAELAYAVKLAWIAVGTWK